MNGVLVVNKPAGVTSSAVCLSVKRMLRLRKAGHLGTLDPLATGVLPLCLNEGTKLVQFLMRSDKEYLAGMRLGIVTDTQDCQGKELSRSDAIPRDEQYLREVVREFAGTQLQTPPMYSALKRNGVPLYKIARQGGSVDREQRRITVHDLEIVGIALPEVTLRVCCTHGTYIRTLCHDIGQRLGCGAHMSRLQRVRSGMFHIDRAVDLEDVAGCSPQELMESHFFSVKEALRAFPALTVTDAVAQKLQHGAPVTVSELDAAQLSGLNEGQQVTVLTGAGVLIAVVEMLAAGPGSGETQERAFASTRVFMNEA